MKDKLMYQKVQPTKRICEKCKEKFYGRTNAKYCVMCKKVY